MMRKQKKMDKSNSILPILKYGNSILRRPVKNITNFTSLPVMAKKMFNTMYEEGGIGLAANQVGWSLNLLVLDASNIDDNIDYGPYVFINTKIINIEGSVNF